MSYGYGGYGQPPQGGAPPPGGGYPPQQGYGGYPPQAGGYPPQAGGYPPQAGGYPPAAGSSPYPPAPGGAGYPPAGGAGYPPAAGGYPPAAGGYPPAGVPGGYPPPGQTGGIGFESMGARGPPQPSAQSYGQSPGGYYPPAGGYQQPGGAYPPQQPGYGAPATTGYGAPPATTGYGAPPAAGYGAPAATAYQPPGGYGAPGPYYSQQATKMSGTQLASGMAAMKIATHGTVKTHSPFNAEEDTKILRKAMKGLGTDEKAIINVLAYRSNKQRQEIIICYKQAYGKDLIKDLKSELSGNFESLVKALMMKPRHYDLYCLERAMSGIGTDEAALIEILASRTNAEIREIKELYKTLKKKNLEKELKSETSGHFARLLVSLANASRNESPTVDQAKARADAQALYQAGEKKWGTDESTFNMIMCSRSIPQLRATFIEYHKVANRDLVKSIESEFSGDIEDGLKAIVETARSPPAYFAKRLHKSMAGAGTDDHTLIRIVTSRSEVDMVEIKQEFQRMYGKSLSGFIDGDTSGDYKALLKALVGS